MTLPSMLLGFLVSTLFGALFHLWKGGGVGRLLFDLALAAMGFWAGHWAADMLGLELGVVGPLQLAAGSLAAVIFLLVGHFLSLDPNKGK